MAISLSSGSVLVDNHFRYVGASAVPQMQTTIAGDKRYVSETTVFMRSPYTLTCFGTRSMSYDANSGTGYSCSTRQLYGIDT